MSRMCRLKSLSTLLPAKATMLGPTMYPSDRDIKWAINTGPFDLVLCPGDVIAQIVVGKVTSPPALGVKGASVTYNQDAVSGTSSGK